MLWSGGGGAGGAWGCREGTGKRGGGCEISESTVKSTGNPRDSEKVGPVQGEGLPAPSGNRGPADTLSSASPRPNSSNHRMEKSSATFAQGWLE